MNRILSSMHEPQLSRRKFIAAAATALACAITGQAGNANAASKTRDGMTADELWAQAVAEATAAGETVHPITVTIGEPDLSLQNTRALLGDTYAYTWGFLYLDAVTYVRIGAIAHFYLNSSNQIADVYGTNVYCESALYEVTWCSPGAYTRIDGGSTLAIHYVCTLTDTTLHTSRSFACYVEYYYDGGGYISFG